MIKSIVHLASMPIREPRDARHAGPATALLSVARGEGVPSTLIDALDRDRSIDDLLRSMISWRGDQLLDDEVDPTPVILELQGILLILDHLEKLDKPPGPHVFAAFREVEELAEDRELTIEQARELEEARDELDLRDVPLLAVLAVPLSDPERELAAFARSLSRAKPAALRVVGTPNDRVRVAADSPAANDPLMRLRGDPTLFHGEVLHDDRGIFVKCAELDSENHGPARAGKPSYVVLSVSADPERASRLEGTVTRDGAPVDVSNARRDPCHWVMTFSPVPGDYVLALDVPRIDVEFAIRFGRLECE